MTRTLQDDWVDMQFQRRKADSTDGYYPSITQQQHADINARYPGATLEYCVKCDTPTGRAGRHDDSLFIGDEGPFCEGCHENENADAE